MLIKRCYTKIVQVITVTALLNTVFTSTVHAAPDTFDWTSIGDFIDDIYKIIIAIGVVATALLLPYIAVMFATGSPESIKKGQEWLTSLFTGLILLLLSATIIRISGQELFGI